MCANIVVVDAGPLHYLVLVDCAEVLPCLFQRVLVPFAVRDELIHASAPSKVKEWILNAPSWLETARVTSSQFVRGLHPGETEVLQLALEKKAETVLMDDMDGRVAARRLGLVPIFTLALLELSAEKDLIDLPDAVAKLRQTSFFISNELLEAALDRDRERREEA